ncbi:hypothetical protein LCGC14_2520850 [marine sediment metagenome]|uniref:Uncharacterized protein n=1 Tax=marine sediment metagenome TaxID=412755 RepID=A0A0F9AWE2_9ZZZZ|nr:hypothetical protein [Nitrosopumilus sp.]
MAYSVSSQVYVLGGFSITEVSQANIETLIAFTDAEIDSLFNRSFDDETAFTEYISLYLPKRADDIEPNRIVTSYYPIQSISEFILLTSTSSTTTTLATLSSTMMKINQWQTADYFIDPTIGLIELSSRTLQYSPSKAKIRGTYGYTTVPVYVQELSAILTAIRAWVNFLGGNYDRLNRYKLPEQEYDKGDFYDRGLKAIDKLSDRANSLVSLIGEKYKSQFFSTSGGYF